jgi:hypothetical protein
MKVYTLTGFGQEEGEIVLGVYSSEAKADLQKEKYIDKKVKSYKFDYYTIQERALDAEADDDHL